MNKRLSSFILCLVLFSVLVTAFHHHDDSRLDHSDCATCAVAHHSLADLSASFADGTYQPPSFPAYFAPFVLTCAVSRYFPSPRNRAPPA